MRATRARAPGRVGTRWTHPRRRRPRCAPRSRASGGGSRNEPRADLRTPPAPCHRTGRRVARRVGEVIGSEAATGPDGRSASFQLVDLLLEELHLLLQRPDLLLIVAPSPGAEATGSPARRTARGRRGGTTRTGRGSAVCLGQKVPFWHPLVMPESVSHSIPSMCGRPSGTSLQPVFPPLPSSSSSSGASSHCPVSSSISSSSQSWATAAVSPPSNASNRAISDSSARTVGVVVRRVVDMQLPSDGVFAQPSAPDAVDQGGTPRPRGL